MTAPIKYAPLDVEETLARLPLGDKIKLLGGEDFWHTVPVPAHNVPRVRVSDGPNGVRGTRFFNGVPASVTPSSTGSAASWDADLIEQVGQALGEECRAKGAAVLLGPTANTARSPLGGRGFESFSADPHLNGMIAASYIKGVQSKGVVACLKHFVANDQEFERFSNDSVVSQRALREIYLEPFRLAIKHAHPHSIMTSYNRVNGIHCSEDPFVLKEILRGEWGWKGLVMSDWTGVVSTDLSMKAGLDLEMPGPPAMRGATVSRQLGAGKITVKDIDDRVRNLLELANRAIASGIPFDAEEQSVDTPELRALLRKSAASAVVLLKNEKSLLPIAPSTKTIAVIGSNAKVAVPSGGGSASLASTYTISPLEGITEAAEAIGAKATFSMGASAFRYLPIIDPYLADAKVSFYIKNPVSNWFDDVKETLPEPDWSTPTKSALAFMIDGIPFEKLGKEPHCAYTAKFTPDTSGEWELSLGSVGYSKLYLDGKLIVDNHSNFKAGELFFGMGSLEVVAKTTLEAGKTYDLVVRQWSDPDVVAASPFPVSSALRIGAFPVTEPTKARNEAAELAKKSDLAIVIVGTNPDWESEGHDRKTIALPGESDELVKAVLAANPNTIVVTQSGMPVAMPWVKDAATIVHAFFGGNELGNGLADILFGKVNPSGKLPVTFPVRLEDNPAFHQFGITAETPGKSVYSEGIYVDYRHYQRTGVAPLWAFGHGLSYSSFEFTGLEVSKVSAEGKFSATFTIKNTGKVAGAEVAQLYIAAPVEGRITSPKQELKGFKKVYLEAGESKKITIDVEKEAFSYWNEPENTWIAPAGTYGVLIGSTSENILASGEAKLEKTFKWRGL